MSKVSKLFVKLALFIQIISATQVIVPFWCDLECKCYDFQYPGVIQVVYNVQVLYKSVTCYCDQVSVLVWVFILTAGDNDGGLGTAYSICTVDRTSYLS